MSRQSISRSVILGFCIGLSAPLALAAQAVSFPPFVEVRVPKPPTVAHLNDQNVLVYELHLTNLAATPLTLKRVVALGDGGASLSDVADSALTGAVARRGVTGPAAERTRIGPGLWAIVYEWVPLTAGAATRSIHHRLTFQGGAGADSAKVEDLETLSVPVASDVTVIGPPLRGGSWLAANGPSYTSGHRRTFVPISGGVYIGQRFAIDYVKLNAAGTGTFTGDSLKNDSYAAYGQDALAVADGIVSEVKDGIPQNVPGVNSRAVPITLETVGGNHVIIDLGGGRYAFYAHLQPGSIKVKVGDRVKRGQVIGLVGNSGNSTEPHLHFHMSDGNSPLGSEGIPYVHESFEIVGRCGAGLGGCTKSAAVVRRQQMPAANELVRFPQ
jgi:biotin carboxyl carrier protein